jgi:zinc protease
MIDFDRYTLKNGLRVIVHRDETTPMVAMNLLYDVGAKDEHPYKTGFAHLFEHLMFGGSINIPTYDEPLQKVGGENNAFTNNDITNYYIILPAENTETGFWLESDRMLCLDFSPENLEIQKNVVIEEYKQRYLNQPYGDVWLILRPLTYKVHPYQWATIGKEKSHIENATLEDVREFFFHHYAPNNSILVIAGNIKKKQIISLAEKWFSPIDVRNIPERKIPKEPLQKQERKLQIERDVPFNAIFKAFHMCSRNHEDFHATDLISDILANGKSSRLYQRLVQKKKLFSEINAYITGEIDPGLLVVSGKLMKNVKMKTAENAINEELDKLKTELITERELNKVKNKVESTMIFGMTNILNKAMNLAFYELLGDAGNLNTEIEKYHRVSPVKAKEVAVSVLKPENCSTLYYLSKKH